MCFWRKKKTERTPRPSAVNLSYPSREQLNQGYAAVTGDNHWILNASTADYAKAVQQGYVETDKGVFLFDDNGNVF